MEIEPGHLTWLASYTTELNSSHVDELPTSLYKPPEFFQWSVSSPSKILFESPKYACIICAIVWIDENNECIFVLNITITSRVITAAVCIILP